MPNAVVPVIVLFKVTLCKRRPPCVPASVPPKGAFSFMAQLYVHDVAQQGKLLSSLVLFRTIHLMELLVLSVVHACVSILWYVALPSQRFTSRTSNKLRYIFRQAKMHERP